MTVQKKMFVIRAFESSPHKPIWLSFYDKIENVTRDKISKPMQTVSCYTQEKTLQQFCWFYSKNLICINTDTNTFKTSCAKNNISSTSLRITLKLQENFSRNVKPILNKLTPKIKTKLRDKSMYNILRQICSCAKVGNFNNCFSGKAYF